MIKKCYSKAAQAGRVSLKLPSEVGAGVETIIREYVHWDADMYIANAFSSDDALVEL